MIDDLKPSVFVRRGADGHPEQQATACLTALPGSGSLSFQACADGREVVTPVAVPVADEVTVYLPLLAAAGELRVELLCDGETVAGRTLLWTPPRQWTVHLVNLSHHDVGYTNLPSLVLEMQRQSLLQYLELARAADHYPDSAQQRIVVEQCWSVDYFLRHATAGEAEALLARVRSGHVELTALFGNMTTELCGHESFIRNLYQGARLAQRTGVPIVSAEHCDIPGVARGLAEILTGSGIEFLDCAFPYYDSWGGEADRPAFWDVSAVFGNRETPGAFWWEAPSGRRLLVWSNNVGCNGENDPALPRLAAALRTYEDEGYPYSVMRWPVTGSSRDNSPYVDFATTVKTWNEAWLSPRLICSTNANFYADLKVQLPADLPVHHGDIPGQDYPLAAGSTAAATATNRRNHHRLPGAETLATMAAAVTPYAYQADVLSRAYEEVNWHDEHTWGHNMPCGPGHAASELEKAAHAHRAAALAYDVETKAMARIADAVQLDGDDVHLVVFNPSPYPRTDLVVAPMREIENCISELKPVQPGGLKPVALGTRWHVNPSLDLVAGNFDLIDVACDRVVDFDLTELRSPLAGTPYAAQRIGLSEGGPRLGFFEEPQGLRHDLRFIAEDVPPLGYRTYRLRPVASTAGHLPVDSSSDVPAVIENEFYRVTVDRSGAIASIYDKALDRELVDAGAAHACSCLLVRDAQEIERSANCTTPPAVVEGQVQRSIFWSAAAPGHPVIELEIRLTAGIKRVDLEIGLLKDPTPNLEALVPFPLAVPEGRYTIEEPLNVANPETDRMPGAFSNRLTAQDWIKVTDGEISVLWCSLDAAVVSIGRLWPSRMSPAHSVLIPKSQQRPQTADELRGGGLYSSVCYNNLGTNFSVSQSGPLIFRYVIGSTAGDASIGTMRQFAAQGNLPLTTIFTQHPYPRTRPVTDSFLSIDNAAVTLLTCKHAEDGKRIILRLWNPTDTPQSTTVTLPAFNIDAVIACDLVERETDTPVAHTAHAIQSVIEPRAVVTLGIACQPE